MPQKTLLRSKKEVRNLALEIASEAISQYTCGSVYDITSLQDYCREDKDMVFKELEKIEKELYQQSQK